MDGIISKEGKKTVIGKVTAKAAAGEGAVVIDFTAIYTIVTFEEHAAFIIRVDHIDLSFLLVLLNELCQRFISEFT